MFIVADLVSLNIKSFSIKHVNNENSSVFYRQMPFLKATLVVSETQCLLQML